MHLLNFKWAPSVILLLLVCVIYLPSLNFEYVLDDKIVFTENNYVKEGLNGIYKILTTETFEGYFGEQKDILPGARYRPLSLVTFAIEYAAFGANSYVSHGINISFYLVAIWLIFITLTSLFKNLLKEKTETFALVATALFAIHPVHVEAVANIKGRDEIMVLILSFATLYYSLKYFESKHYGNFGAVSICFFLAFLSKENALTFLAVIPMSLLIFSKGSIRTWSSLLTAFFVPLLAYIGLRYNAVGYLFGSADPTDLMNNPFLHMSGSEKYATIFHTLLLYLKLGIFPHPLTHDYYPFHIPTMRWTDITPILSVLLHILLGLYAIIFLKMKKIVCWAILFYMLTLSIVSNLAINVGTFMNERFLFIPSLAFTVILSYGYLQLANSKRKILRYLAISFLSLLIVGFLAKSILRVPAWKNSFTLNSAAVKVSKNSARANLFMGTTYFNLYRESQDRSQKNAYLHLADNYITTSFNLFPNYKNALHMKAGVAAELFKENDDIEGLLNSFSEVIMQSPQSSFVHTYLEYLNGIGTYDSQLILFYYNIGYKELHMRLSRHDWAAKFLLYGVEINENDKNINLALSKIYKTLNRPNRSQYYQSKALSSSYD